MNLKNQLPIFVPTKFRDEIEKMSKAALMDLAWDFATTATTDYAPAAGEDGRDGQIMDTLRARRDIILEHRRP